MEEMNDDFSLLYPDIDRDELLRDEDFNYFAKGKLESESLSSVYGRFSALLTKIRNEEKEKAAAILANRLASVGAVSTAAPPEETLFTREQVKAMSPAEIRKNYEKIIKSQKKWQ